MQRNELFLAAALCVLVLSGAVCQFYHGAGKTAEIVITHSQRMPFENAATAPIPAAVPTAAAQEIAGNDSRLFLFLNSADLKQLMAVSGIGEKLGGQILAKRNEIGRFSSIDQILTVNGVGDAKLEAMRRYVLQVDSASAAPTPFLAPSFFLPPAYSRPIFIPAPALRTPASSRNAGRPLPLNQASLEDLTSVSGFGESLAQSIINARRTARGFKSWKEVDAIPGIGEQRLKLLRQYFYLPNDRKTH